MILFNTAYVAEKTGLLPNTIQRLHKRRGWGMKVGRQLWFDTKEVNKIIRNKGKVGRPRKK